MAETQTVIETKTQETQTEKKPDVWKCGLPLTSADISSDESDTDDEPDPSGKKNCKFL